MAAGQALYREWRPRRFGDVIGQEHVTRSLLRALRQGRVSHAYLFCGPRGTGKTTIARILAQALLCRNPQEGEPCGECDRCQAARADRLLAIEEIDAASHRGIEDVRALRERISLSAGDAERRVHIVDEVHMLTPEAFNALLKTLEEPPPGVHFVLATTEPRRVPVTILSRCQRFDFHRHSESQIVRRLREVADSLGAKVDDEALATIAMRADGGMRDALVILEQCLVYADGALTDDDVAAVLGTASRRDLAALAEAVAAGDEEAIWRGVGALHDEGRDLAQVTRDLIALWRRRWGESRDDGERRAALAILERLLTLEGELRRGAPPRIAVEVALTEAALASREGRADGASAPSGPGAGRTARREEGAPPVHEVAAPATAGGAPAENAVPKAPRAARRTEAKAPDLAALRREWQAILDELPAPVRSTLMDSRPAALADGVLTIQFRHEWHRANARTQGYLVKLTEHLGKRMGVAWRVECHRDLAREPDAPDAPGAEAPGGPAAEALSELGPEARALALDVLEKLPKPATLEVVRDSRKGAGR